MKHERNPGTGGMLARLLGTLMLVPAVTGLADDVGDARHLLCATMDAHVCRADGGCEWLAPADINIPRFIRVDARTGVLSTTASSGQNRRTEAASVSRETGTLVLQGHEAGRSFSLAIDEATGEATFAAASPGRSVSVFAACTPAE